MRGKAEVRWRNLLEVSKFLMEKRRGGAPPPPSCGSREAMLCVTGFSRTGVLGLMSKCPEQSERKLFPSRAWSERHAKSV